MSVQPLTYEKIRVRPDRIEMLVRINDARFRETTPRILSRCIEDFPLLPTHACRNPKGSLFKAVMNQTSVPHLLEHLIVDMQIQMLDALIEQLDINKQYITTQQRDRAVRQDLAWWQDRSGQQGISTDINFHSSIVLSDDVVVTGTTQWDQADPFLAKVSVSFVDDLIALSACKKALVYINKVLLTQIE